MPWGGPSYISGKGDRCRECRHGPVCRQRVRDGMSVQCEVENRPPVKAVPPPSNHKPRPLTGVGVPFMQPDLEFTSADLIAWAASNRYSVRAWIKRARDRGAIQVIALQSRRRGGYQMIYRWVAPRGDGVMPQVDPPHTETAGITPPSDGTNPVEETP